MKNYVMKSVKKIPWRVTLPDDQTITLMPPKMGALVQMQNADLRDQAAQIDLIVDALNCNAEKKEFDRSYIEKNFDITDLADFSVRYTQYLNEVASQKN